MPGLTLRFPPSQAFHPDWQYMFWDEAACLRLLEDKYDSQDIDSDAFLFAPMRVH